MKLISHWPGADEAGEDVAHFGLPFGADLFFNINQVNSPLEDQPLYFILCYLNLSTTTPTSELNL